MALSYTNAKYTINEFNKGYVRRGNGNKKKAKRVLVRLERRAWQSMLLTEME